MTASTPRRRRSSRTTGMPPPPAPHHEAGLHHRQDRRRVEDLQRLGRGDHAAPALLAAVLPGLAVLHEYAGFLGAQVAADRLGRPREPRVVGDDQRPGHDRRGAALDVALAERGVERVHQDEAERGLGLRAAPVQRHGRYDGGRELVLDQQVAHLRAVAVGEHDLEVLRDQIGDGGHRDLGRGDLVLGPRPAVGLRHGVAAECDQDPHAQTLGRRLAISASMRPSLPSPSPPLPIGRIATLSVSVALSRWRWSGRSSRCGRRWTSAARVRTVAPTSAPSRAGGPG